MRRKPCRIASEKGFWIRSEKRSLSSTTVSKRNDSMLPRSNALSSFMENATLWRWEKRNRSLSRMVGRRRGRLPFYAKTNIQRSAVPLQGSSEHLFKLWYGCGSLVPIRSWGSAYERVKIVGLASADQNISAICTPY